MNEPNQQLKPRVLFTEKRYTRCNSAGVARTQKGFTLIELMIVVAVIGVLAGIAVTFFGGTQRKTKARAEVISIFAEFKIKQEQSMLEFRTYRASGPNNDESDFFPAAIASNGNKTVLPALPVEWGPAQLNIRPPNPALHCQYVSVIGDAGSNANVDAIAAGQFLFGAVGTEVPADSPWYYLLAHCDMDSDPGTDSFYFQYSGDNQLYFQNQGK